MRYRAFVALATMAGALVTGGWFLQRGLDGSTTAVNGVRLFDQVVSHVADRFVDSLSRDSISADALQGMLRELNDPYTVFLSGDRLALLNENTSGRYAGLGVQIDVRDGWITVVSPLPNSPAERAGIQTGDRIVEMEGRSTEGWAGDEAQRELRGPQGVPRQHTIDRPGLESRLPFRLTRARHSGVPPSAAPICFPATVGYLDIAGVFSASKTASRAPERDRQHEEARA